MDYDILSESDRAEIIRRRKLQAEADHFNACLSREEISNRGEDTTQVDSDIAALESKVAVLNSTDLAPTEAEVNGK